MQQCLCWEQSIAERVNVRKVDHLSFRQWNNSKTETTTTTSTTTTTTTNTTSTSTESSCDKKENNDVIQENPVCEDIAPDNSEWKEHMKKMRDYSEEQFDKLIVTLNGGALAITVGFVKDIVEITSVTDTRLLKASWLCFILSLFFILLSHRTSILSTDYDLKDNELYSNVWDICTKVLNWASILTLVAGIGIFIIFVAITF